MEQWVTVFPAKRLLITVGEPGRVIHLYSVMMVTYIGAVGVCTVSTVWSLLTIQTQHSCALLSHINQNTRRQIAKEYSLRNHCR